MRAYKTSDAGLEELGDFTQAQLPHLLEEVDADPQEEAGLGLCRSDTDFLQITPLGDSQYLIYSDCVCASASKGFLGWLSGKKHIDKVVDRTQAIEIANFYMEQSREEFERNYS